MTTLLGAGVGDLDDLEQLKLASIVPFLPLNLIKHIENVFNYTRNYTIQVL